MTAPAESVESIDDLLVEILLKLAPRPLIHCKLVTKRWRSIIVNRVLVLVRRNPAPPAVGLFHPTGRFQTYKYLCFDSKTKKDRPPFLFLDNPAWHSRIHQSCNGLLLCCVDKPDFFDLFPPTGDLCFGVYNPTTKRSAVLPHPCSPASILAVNLAFDPSKSPFYKAVCVTRSSVLCRVDVYSSESKAWRLSSGEPPFALNALCAGREAPHIFRRGVYWNGSIHWIDSSAREVLCFNVDDERFRKLPLPDPMKKKKLLYDVEIRESYFGESCGHLHIAPVVRASLHVYEMEEDYSGWLFKWRIRIDMAPYYAKPSMFCSVLSITRGKKGSLLFALMDNGVIEKYLLERQIHRSILRRRRPKNDKIPYSGLHGFQHIESLAPV